MTGQEYHYACCLSSPCQKRSDSYNQIFFAQQSGEYKLKPKGSIRVGFRCLYPACVMAYLLMWLTLITITTGTYLMNEYGFVKERKAKKDLSLYLPLSERSAPLFQIFFQFFYNFFFSSMDSTRRNTYLLCICSFRFFFVEQCINQFLILLWQP